MDIVTDDHAIEAAIKAAREAAERAPYLDEATYDSAEGRLKPKTYLQFFKDTWQGDYADEVFQTAAKYAATAAIRAYLAAMEAEGWTLAARPKIGEG